MTSTTDTETTTPHDHARRRRARTWTWAGTAVAATVTAVLLAPAPIAAADPVVPAGIPCASQIQAFYNARQAVINHNDEASGSAPEPEADAFNAQGRVIFEAQVQAQQEALTCLRVLAGRAAPTLPDPVPHAGRTSQTPQSSPYGSGPPAPPSTGAPGGESDDEWVEKMQDKIYDWFKENLERFEKYQEKQQEEQEKKQEEQNQQDHDRCDRAGQATDAPAPTTDPGTAHTATPAPPICPGAPTTTTTPEPSY